MGGFDKIKVDETLFIYLSVTKSNMEANTNFSAKDDCGSTTDNPDFASCGICKIEYIHKNDFENHINGRSHKKKLREKDKELGKIEEKFECEACQRKFRGKEYYQAHLGSKTHKRNLRKLQAAKDSTKPVSVELANEKAKRASKRSRRISTGDHLQIFSVDFTKDKYKIRLEKIEDLNYKSYVYSLAAYLSIRLALNQKIDNFKISVNDREWGVFGDVVIEISCKEKMIIYAIQCKKVTQTFGLIEHLADIKLDVTKQYKYIAQLKKAGKDVSEIKFVIFTTFSTRSNFSHSITLKPAVLNNWNSSTEEIMLEATLKVKSLAKRSEIINVTNDPENMFSFTLSENENCHLPQLFLFTNQRILPSMLSQLLKKKFEKIPDISADYLKYIENWVDGRLGGNYKLKKKDVILKIGEILLSPFIVSPKKVHSKHNSFAVWNQVIDKVDLTLVRNEPFILSKVCQPLNTIIEETLSVNIDTITRSINMKKQTFDNVPEPIKSYFFQVAHGLLQQDIPLHLVYNVFWKAGRIPLLMSTEDNEKAKELIFDVILFMKQLGVNKKFLIKSKDQNVNRFKINENLKIFTCLDDVKDLMDWNEVKIRVSDSFQPTLNTIQSSDPFFFKWVTPNIFFDISVGKYHFKPNYTSKKLQNKNDVLKIILSDDVKDELENKLYPPDDLSQADANNISPTRLRGVHPGIL